MSPRWRRLLLSGVDPITLGIGAVGSVAVGVGLAVTVGTMIGLVGNVAVIAGFAIFYCVGVVVQEVQRSDLEEAAFGYRGPAIDAHPIEDFYIAPAHGPVGSTELPDFVRRTLMDEVIAGLRNQRFVILTGKSGSGMSRLVYEALCEWQHMVLVARRMGVASEDPLMMLMRDSGGFATDEPQVLYLRDFTSRLLAGSITTDFVRDWLARHPKASIVVTLNPADLQRIEANGTEAEDELEGLKGLAAVLRLAPTLKGAELEEAREKFPTLEEEQREWLPSYLVSADPLRTKFRDEDGGNGLGRAIVRTVADWQRAGPKRPAPEGYVREMVSRYLESAPGGSFAAALAWATEPMGFATRLLYPIEGENGEIGYEVDEIVLGLLDDRETGAEAVPLPRFVWAAVEAELLSGVEDGTSDDDVAEALLGMGQAAMARGHEQIAARLLRKAARHGDADQHQRIVQLLSAGIGFGTASQSLVNSRRGDGVIQRLGAVEELAQARKEHSRRPRGGGPARPTAFYAWIYRRRSFRALMRFLTLGIADAFSASVGLAAGLALRALIGGSPDWALTTEAFTETVVLWSATAVIVCAFVKLYRQDAPRAHLGGIVLAMGAMGGIGLAASLAEGFQPHAALLGSFYGALIAAFLDYRLRVRYDSVSRGWVKDHVLQSRTLVIGSARQAMMFRRALPHLSRPADYVGYLATKPERQPGPDYLGSVHDLARIVVEKRVGRVVIAAPEMSPESRQRLADRCHLRGLVVEAVASPTDVRAGSAAFIAGQPLVLLPLPPLWQGDTGFYVKRALDIALALVAILVLSPLLILLSVVSWWKSGQIVIRSWRPGLGGSVFGMYRFPTTPRDAAGPGDPSDPDSDPARDTTGFGAWLRNRGLDELPQLFNILLGQMSFVGPRPLRITDHSQLKGEQLLRYVVRPGATSAWQISTPPTLTHAELFNLDVAYLRHWSILTDLEILVKTARLVIRGRSALPRLVHVDDLGTELAEPPQEEKTREARHRGWRRSLRWRHWRRR